VNRLLGTLAAIIAVAAAGIVSYLVLERLAAERPTLSVVQHVEK